jgi:uncharacterized protein YabN with tetrapyrrole methylase and pyrophosphatase domain
MGRQGVDKHMEMYKATYEALKLALKHDEDQIVDDLGDVLDRMVCWCGPHARYEGWEGFRGWKKY